MPAPTPFEHRRCQCFRHDEIRILNPALCFNSPRSSGRYLPESYTRDVEGAYEALAALAPYGYVGGEKIRNKPPELPASPEDPYIEIDVELGTRNVVFWGTRFALDDALYRTDEGELVRPFKWLPLGRTTLERDVFGAVRPYFEYLDRAEFRVPKGLRRYLKKNFEDHFAIEFYQEKWAPYKQLGGKPTKLKDKEVIYTLGVAMRLESIWPGGPSLIAVWAMDGTISVVWSYLVAKYHPEWLLEPGLRLVELVGPKIPERPTSLRFADEWRRHVVLEAPVDGVVPA